MKPHYLVVMKQPYYLPFAKWMVEIQPFSDITTAGLSRSGQTGGDAALSMFGIVFTVTLAFLIIVFVFFNYYIKINMNHDE